MKALCCLHCAAGGAKNGAARRSGGNILRGLQMTLLQIAGDVDWAREQECDLIVDFAEQLRAQGKSIADAAVEAARIRLRPILMTSFAVYCWVLCAGAGVGRERLDAFPWDDRVRG